MRRLLVASVCAVVLVLTAGCANQPGTPMTVPAPIADGSPADLIGMWRVLGAETETHDTWLRLDRGGFMLWRDCGMLSGSWVVRGDAVLFSDPWGSSGGCDISAVPWLTEVMGYQSDGDGVDLLAASGDVVGSLTVDGGPEPRDDLDTSYAEPPELTAEVEEWPAMPSPLPTGLRPATAADLAGRWISPDARGTDAHVEFASDTTWTGSDGCNGNGGRWVVPKDGTLLGTTAPSTDIGCDGAPIPSWVSGAASVGFDGDDLVLLDAAGAELGR